MLVHDEKSRELAFLLSELGEMEGMPAPVGVFLAIDRFLYEDKMEEQIEHETREKAKEVLKNCYSQVIRGKLTKEI